MTDHVGQTLLDVQDLRVTFGPVTAVDGVSLHVKRGEAVAIVGESGSGKSATAMAITQLVRYQGGTIGSDSRVLFDGLDLGKLGEDQLRELRGRRIGIVFQDHSGALNPVMRIRAQIAESLLVHRLVPDRETAWAESVQLLTDVGMSEPQVRSLAYPHQLSGGMRQRTLIASAIAPTPELLIADEPTTALDAVVQRQIVTLLSDLRSRLGHSLLMISHDLRLVAGIADRVYVMYGGKVVEDGPTRQIFTSPQASYTRALLNASPSVTPPVSRRSNGSPNGRTNSLRVIGPISPSPSPLLRVASLSHKYPGVSTYSVESASFELAPGDSLGVVGESGSGKSTLARCVLRLIEPSSGRIEFDGNDVANLSKRGMRDYRRRAQMVFQDPRASLDPRMRVEAILAEPMRIFGTWGADLPRQQRLTELLEMVGMDQRALRKYPREFSGGQLQRIAIARALASNPDMLVCDEAVSSLDATLAAQIIDLLKKIQADTGLSYLFISHDLSIVQHFCHDLIVMKSGKVVEQGSCASVFANPQHEYTRTLLAAQPSMAATWST